MNTLPHKGYGRIYVDKAENVVKVKRIIKELDEFEYSYLPKGMVAPFSEYPSTVYTHKFSDLDMTLLTAVCFRRGIYIWAFNSSYVECPADLSIYPQPK